MTLGGTGSPIGVGDDIFGVGDDICDVDFIYYLR
jgi:hypothetical protein